MSTAAALGLASASHAEERNFEIYGYAQVDYIQDFNRVAPEWDATLRPSKIPTEDGIYGDDGQSIISARQSRLGVQARQPVGDRELYVKFEFDLFGVGDDAGKTTFRLRHAYGEWGPVLAGQTNSLFMDIDTFPNTIDYWGPNGMVFLRNPQVRYTYKTGPHKFAVAIEQPSNDIDPGNLRLVAPDIAADIQGDEQIPDLTAQYRYGGDWGHVQLAGILRRVAYETRGTPNNEPSDEKTGWGFNLTSNIKAGEKDVIHLAAVYGEGIASYMNDGGVDLAPEVTGGGVGLRGDVVPLFGMVAYYDHYWNDQWSSSIGYSRTQVNNTSFQDANAFYLAQYASANVLYTPAKNLMMGAELLWGSREDNGGASGDDVRIQVSFKYSFSSNDFR
ncbi:MAG: DcaP family trimeric outer membrane transporter [Pseudomonadota bacterium]